jgi:hypothetical protein
MTAAGALEGGENDAGPADSGGMDTGALAGAESLNRYGRALDVPRVSAELWPVLAWK